MITLRQGAYQIIRELSGGRIHQDNQYDVRYVVLKIREAIMEVAHVMIANSIAKGRLNEVQAYVYSYPGLDVADVKDQDFVTLTLPDFYIDLPYSKGIASISADSNPFDSYKRRLNVSVSNSLLAGKLQGEVGWWQEGLTIFLGPKAKVKKKLTVKLVLPAPEAIGLDDPLPVTAEMWGKIIESLKPMLLRSKPQDTITNENPTVTNEQ